MKRSVSLAVIAALLAGLTAFTTHRQVYNWNVNNPENGTPGLYFNLSPEQVKAAFCPGLNNTECAMVINMNNIIVKKP